MIWGLLNGVAPAAITGALFSGEGLFRFIKTNDSVSKTFKDVGSAEMNLLKPPILKLPMELGKKAMAEKHNASDEFQEQLRRAVKYKVSE